MREVEQAGLLGSHFYFLLKFIAGPQKIPLRAMADRAEPGEK